MCRLLTFNQMGPTVTTVLQTVKIILYFLTDIFFATSVVNLKEDNGLSTKIRSSKQFYKQ
jgi:hypothetical protein